MKFILPLSLTAMTLTAGGAIGETLQQGVVGTTGDPVYELRVRGNDGELYKCKRELGTTSDGRPARVCLRDGVVADATVFGAASPGLIAGGAVGGAVLLALVAGDGSGVATTTTTGTM